MRIVKKQPVAKQVFIPFQLVTKESVANFLPKKERAQEEKSGRGPRETMRCGPACRPADGRGNLRPMTGVQCMAVLKALGEMNRLRIMRLLLTEQLGVNAIADRLQISQYNTSKHLRVLKEAGLLVMKKSGKQRLYGVTPSLKDELASNRNVLELDCCTFRFDKLPR